MGAIISSFAGWLVDTALWIPRSLFSLLMQALASLLVAIPAPQWLVNAPAALSALPGGVYWFLDGFQIGTGITIVLSAYVIRWLTRRIPLIG